MSRFDLNLLGALDALLTERNVTRAAERLHVTQPTMSGMLQRLRFQFDDPILIRIGRSMELTPLGRTLIEPTRDALRGIERLVGAEPAFDRKRSTRTFTVMTSDYCAVTFIPQVVRTLSRVAPGVRLDVRPLDAPAERLASGEVDLCVTIDNLRLLQCEAAPELHASPLFSDRFVCVVAADHPLDERSTPADFFRFAYVGVRMPGDLQTIEAATLRAHHPHHRPAYTVADFSMVPHLVVGSRLVGIVQRRLAKLAVATLPVKLLEPPFAIPDINETLLWHARHDEDPAHRWLRDLLAREAADWSRTAAPAPALPCPPPGRREQPRLSLAAEA